MDWVWFLFGFDGRINRARLWLALLAVLGCMMLTAAVMAGTDKLFGLPVQSIHFGVDDIFGVTDPTALRAAIVRLRLASPAYLVSTFFHAVGTLIVVWIYLAASIKRLHDRDKSGWWMIPYFAAPGLYGQFTDRLPDSYLMLPLELAVFGFMIWGFIDLYCLKGTRWTNRFGPNPLPKEQLQPRRDQTVTRAASGWDQTNAMEFVPHQASGVDLTFTQYPAGGGTSNRRH